MTATAPANTQEIAHAQSILNGLESYLDHFVVGQQRLRESLLIGLLSSGHLLLESVPGLAKTTAAAALANAVAGKFSRIQCTPDLLPADIIGSQIYNAHEGSFNTVLGPVHANIVLLDEINRSSAKTQSAMLEAMQEKQTTIGGRRFELPRPFLVMATQNPIEQEGTYQLPEAQLDRFMIKDLLTHPNPNEEVEILSRLDSGVFDKDSVPEPACTLDDVTTMQRYARTIYIDPAITRYLVELVHATRNTGKYLGRFAPFIEYGASPRASIAFTNAGRALAMLRGRNYVIPEDIKDLAHRVLAHRIQLNFEAAAENITSAQIVDALLMAVPTP
ncbi:MULTISPECIES: AAA family ATPase [unclassified Brevibacterium]|uniref:AAA family ATPase n=1 Tax=unclassified Brevibacterium TaxID=2614124 RepID=UPI001082184E|nr:MoxR family ATPase [Brevibacterium sp. S111]TGD09653.1 MoxR family ATPase [Brevibacterium sp. S111]